MKNKTKNIRFGFIVFVILVVFCIAQLAWWVIFQIGQSEIDYNSQISLLERQMNFAINRTNSDFSQVVKLLQYHSEFQSNFDRIKMLIDFDNGDKSIIVGYSSVLENGQIDTTGSIDSTFYTVIDDRNTIYMNPKYMVTLLNDEASNFDLNLSGHNDGQNGQWIDPVMISISKPKLDELKEDSQRRIKMFVSEGSIFFIIMIIGAYLIYRTLQKSEELKRQQVNFMNAVTHELRTPLTSIRLYLETLKGGNVAANKTDQIYTKMLFDCDRLDTMIDNVLSAGRLDTNKYEINLTSINLSTELASCLKEMEQFAHQQNGTLSTEIEPDIFVTADIHAINTAIKAIIENGLKYSPSDRRAITARLFKTGNQAVITISDKGFGISPSEIDNIFDRFYRINNDNTKRVKGTGLGLYIASQIVKAHNGKIEGQSAGENNGSTFIIKLPLG